jgi:hypothetical protein
MGKVTNAYRNLAGNFKRPHSAEDIIKVNLKETVSEAVE